MSLLMEALKQQQNGPTAPQSQTGYSVSDSASTEQVRLAPRTKKHVVDPAHVVHLKR